MKSRGVNKGIRMLVLTMAVACVYITGCSVKGTEEQSGESTEAVGTTKAVVIEGTENTDRQQDIAVAEEMGKGSGLSRADGLVLNPELFDGTSMKIWNGKGNTLLALKENSLYLYDVPSARIKAKTETELSEAATFYPYQDGYFVIDWVTKGELEGKTLDNGSMLVEVGDDDVEYFGIFYDDSLKEIKKIVLNDIVENPGFDRWTVSPDGSMLGYYDPWEGLNIYDLNSHKKQNLLGIGVEEGGLKFLGPNVLFFEEGKNTLFFTGQTDQNGSTCASWGRIGIDGKGFENHVMDYDFGTAAGYHGGKLLIGEDSIFFEGGIAVVDTETGNAVYHTDFDRTLPLSGPYFSPDGTIFATAALDTKQMKITIYETEGFSSAYKELITDDREEMFYRSPQICLFPELQACIVCMGGHNDIPQETVLLTY